MTTLSAIIRFVHLAAAALLLGSIAFELFVRRPALRAAGAERERESMSFGAWPYAASKWTLVALVISAFLSLWFQAAAAGGVPVIEALRPAEVGGILLATRYGTVWLLRAGLMVLLIAAIFRAKTTPTTGQQIVIFL